jgi:hypothetical protein
LYSIACESSHLIGEYTDIIFPPPLTIGNIVQSSPFLKPDGRYHSTVEESIRFLNANESQQPILYYVLNPPGPW